MPADNVKTQQQIRDLEDQLEDAIAQRDGKTAQRLRQRIEFLKSTLESIQMKNKSRIAKRMDRGSRSSTPVTGKLSHTSLLESRLLRTIEQDEQSLDVQVVIGMLVKGYSIEDEPTDILKETVQYLQAQPQSEQRGQWIDILMEEILNRSHTGRYADELPEGDYYGDVTEESVREQDESPADVDHYWDERELSPVKPVARLYLLQSDPNNTKLKLRIQTREGKVLYEATLNAQTDDLSTALSNAHQFASKIDYELDEDPAMVTQWAAATKRREESRKKEAKRYGSKKSSLLDIVRYARANLASKGNSLTTPYVLDALKDELGLTDSEIAEVEIELKRFEDSEFKKRQTTYKAGAQFEESRRRETLSEDAKLAKLAIRLTDVGFNQKDNGFKKTVGRRTVIVVAGLRSGIASVTLYENGKPIRRIPSVLYSEVEDKADDWFDGVPLDYGESRCRRSREAATWPLAIPAGWQNVSGLLPTIQRIFGDNGVRKYIKIIFDTKGGVLRIQGTGMSSPQPSATFAPTQTGLQRAVTTANSWATLKPVRKESRNPKAVRERYLAGASLAKVRAEKSRAVFPQAQSSFDAFIRKVSPNAAALREPALEYDKIIATLKVDGKEQIARYDQDIVTGGWSWQLLPVGRVK